jgi:hypothetical protein
LRRDFKSFFSLGFFLSSFFFFLLVSSDNFAGQRFFYGVFRPGFPTPPPLYATPKNQRVSSKTKTSSTTNYSFFAIKLKMPRNKKVVHEEIEEDLIDDEPPAIEPYTILGLEKTATPDEVKQAYRKAALKHHPGTHSLLLVP